jgi:hypothetical protein
MASEVSKICVLGKLENARQNTSFFNENGRVYFFLIRPFDLGEIRELMYYLFREQPTFLFGLTIDGRDNYIDRENENEWIQLFCSLLTHPEYYKVNNERVIGFLPTNGDLRFQDSFMSHLNMSMARQAFEHVQITDIPATQRDFNPVKGLLLVGETEMKSQEKFNDFYISRLLLSDVALSLFVFGDILTVNELHNRRNEAGKALADRKIDLAKLLGSYFSKSETLAKIANEKSLLEETLQSKTDYLNFILRKASELNDSDDVGMSDVIKLKKYYNSEYEILPLWYKRFGHIIKVIMGKRTLNSLFNDKAKKYKE